MLVGELSVIDPFPWERLLGYLTARLTPELERIDADRYIRRVGSGEISVSYDRNAAKLRVEASAAVAAQDVLERVDALFIPRHSASMSEMHLRRFPVLASRIQTAPGMRPLGAWSAFELCLRTVIGQQVTVAAAGTLMRRLVARAPNLTAAEVAEADLSNLGMPGKRVETLRGLARALVEERVRFAAPWAELDAQLKALPGFGPWTRAYLAIRLGRDPDAFPETDLGLIRAAGVSSPKELLQAARAWQPFRANAATYLWAVEPD